MKERGMNIMKEIKGLNKSQGNLAINKEGIN